MKHTLFVLVYLCVMGSSLFAVEEERLVWPQGIPKAMLKDAMAVLHLNKPQELIGTIESTATDAGITMDFSMRLIAEKFYHSRNLSGIDVDRPMVVLWRKGRGGMAAIIPVYDRKLFFEK
ncbi:MAG: hypothetical protein HRU15_16215, partial [Planctomycetes bacterium]|nr:hypothetical protein [Planctomycetota bacterium]